jgi:L-ribulose-5-phosphate 3-epimerase
VSRAVGRRELIGRAAAAAGAVLAGGPLAPLLAGAGRRFLVGACDWSIGRAGDPGVFETARQIGLDGVQVSLGSAKDDMRLRRAEAQEECRAAARRAGVAVASLAIGELNDVPYKSDPRTVAWVDGSVDACRALGARTVLLAFFGNGDLRGDPAGVEEVVRRLRDAAPKAEKAGVTLGVESWLSADEHLAILDRVGSPAVQVYYDVCNANDRGYDVPAEIRRLRGRICEFHAKENGALLGRGRVDFARVREAMDAIGYRGWVQIEGAVPEGASVLDSYRANCRFLRGVLA